MPIPTVEDLLAFKLLDSKTKLSDIRKEIKEDWRDSPSRISGAEVVTMEGYTTKRDDYSYEEVRIADRTSALPPRLTRSSLYFCTVQRAFGSYEDMTRARLVCIILLNRRGARLPDWSVTSLSPVFDELWELRGEQATAKDMTELMAGGDRAAALRRKILNARPAPKEKNA